MTKEKIENLISKLNPNIFKVDLINKEAFVYSVEKYIKDILRGKFDDSNFTDYDYERFINTIAGSVYFDCVYSEKVEDLRLKQGKWIKFDQGSDPEPLFRLLSRNEFLNEFDKNVIKSQLKKGDYYVYCTLDEFDRYKVPRAKIVMKGNSIKFINAYLYKKENENSMVDLEDSMEDVVEDKIKEFPNGKYFERQLNYLRKTTNIYHKYLSDEELSIDELRYLYYNHEARNLFDPRIEEIINARFLSETKDMAKVYNCHESQIIFYENELTEDSKYYYFDLNYQDIESAEGLIFPENIGGSLDLRGLTIADGLVLPKHIGRDLYLNSLTSAKGLVLPEYVGGHLLLNSLTDAKDLILPKFIGFDLILSSLTKADGLIFPEYLRGGLDLSGLTSADGLVLPKVVGDILLLSNLKSVDGLVLPEFVSRHLVLNNLTSAKGLVLPKFVGGHVDLSNLDSLDGLIFPEQFDYDIITKFGIINKDNISQYINGKMI